MFRFQLLWEESTPAERQCVGWGFGWFFCLLTAYFVLRPLRETFAVEAGSKELPWLFATTFVTIVCASPLFAALAARLTRPVLVKTVYRFFAANLVVFLWVAQFGNADVQVWLARVFFVWTSVFALFNTSVFWSVLTDLFTNAQSKRLFGLIAAGGTLGGICGSLLTVTYAKQLGTTYLLLLPILFLELGVQAAGRLQRASVNMHPQAATQRLPPPTGGSVWAGLRHVVRSPFLLGVCGFLFLQQLSATQLYLSQTMIVQSEVATIDRPAFFASVNLAIQLLTLGVQTFVFGWIAKRRGVAFALFFVPIVYGASFAALGFSPQLNTLAICVVICSALTYGMIVPSREVLFTVVSREDKYKSKNFIDTAVLRGGDTMSVNLLNWAGKSILTLPFVFAVMCPLAVLWGALGAQLGRTQKQLAMRLETATGKESDDAISV